MPVKPLLPRIIGEPAVEVVAARTIFHLDDPEVTVELGFAMEVGVGGSIGSIEGPDPLAVEGAHIETGRGWPENMRGSVEPVDANENGARVIVAVTHDKGRYACNCAPADVSLDPEFRPQAHQMYPRGKAPGGPRRAV